MTSMVNELEQFLGGLQAYPEDNENFRKYVAKRKLNLSIPVIHISGICGKACVSRYLESIYLAAGYRVASFANSYTGSRNEMIRLEGKDISDDDLAALFKDNRKDFEKFGLTAYECMAAMAYRYFESKKAGLAIIECGLGAAFDPTNIDSLDTRLGIITTVSLDHTETLGTTLSQIALHLSGVVKPQSVTLIGNMDETVVDTIKEECRVAPCALRRVESFHFPHLFAGQFHFDYGPYKDVVINTAAYYQIANASLALEATRILQNVFPVAEEAVRKGLLTSSLPCRAERRGRIVLDAAANPEAMMALARAIPSLAQGKPATALFASHREKNIAVELPTLANVIPNITLTTFPGENVREEMDYMLYMDDFPYVADYAEALHGLLENNAETVVFVTGAPDFVNLVRRLIEEEQLG